MPRSGFQLDVVTDAGDVSRLEIRDNDGAVLAELSQSQEPLDVLSGGWRGRTGATDEWAVAFGVVVPDLTYLTFLAGRRARASGRLSKPPSRIGPFWYAECDTNATRVSVVVAGQSTGVQHLRRWTAARS